MYICRQWCVLYIRLYAYIHTVEIKTARSPAQYAVDRSD